VSDDDRPVEIDWDAEMRRLVRGRPQDARGLADTEADIRLHVLQGKIAHASSPRERNELLRLYYREERNEQYHRTGEDRRYPHRREMMNR
jgi:hypothetical protein